MTETKKGLSWIELLFSLITVAGVLCIFSLDARYRYGISIGIVSSAIVALPFSYKFSLVSDDVILVPFTLIVKES